MIQRLQWFFRPSKPYGNPLTEQRARGLLYFIALALFLIVILALIQIFGSEAVTVENDTIDLDQIVITFSPILLILGFWGVRQGFYEQVSWGIVILALIAVYPIATGTLAGTSVLALVMPIISAGVLLGWRSTVLTLIISLILLSINTIFFPSPTTDYFDFFVVALILSLISLFLIVFGTNIQVAATGYLDELNSLRDVVGSTLSQDVLNDDIELARNSINLIRDQLGYRFVRVFLVENDEIKQRIQTGLNLKQMNVDSDFEIGTSSGLYEAIRRGEVVKLNLDSSDAARQHLLTGTRGALAVPIKVGDSVKGVLDIQSEDVEQFSEGDINTIGLIARQLALNLSQTRIVAELLKELGEQNEILKRQQERLITLERRERQATTQAWANYLSQRGIDFMGFDLDSQKPEAAVAYNLSADLGIAVQTGEISLKQEGQEQILSVPIVLRGYTLGAMSFRVPEGNQTIGPRQQELIRSVVQRLALALENKRLFEQSQAQAQRESKANEVGNLLLSSTDIDTVLHLAADSFKKALGAVQTQIVIRPETPELNGGEFKA